MYPQSMFLRQNVRNVQIFLMKFSYFTAENNLCIFHGQIFVMSVSYKQSDLCQLSPVYTFTVFSTIHHDSPRFLMVRKIGVDRDESWRKVEIFNVTTIPVRMSTILVRCL